MMYWVFRGIFVALMIAVTIILRENQTADRFGFYVICVAVGLSLLIIGIDIFTPRKSLAALVGTFFGLFAGMLMAIALTVVIEMLARTMVPKLWVDPAQLTADMRTQIEAIRTLVNSIEFIVVVICVYLAVTFVMQTKDDIRVVIPYVEFAKQTRGNRPLILDTSVIIDGRIADICDTRIIDSSLVIPRFVLQELQAIADSSDKLKRNRGRRGLDMLNKLQTNDKVEIKISDTRLPSVEEAGDVDQKLLALAKKVDGRVVTNDYNLNKIAQLRGVDVININDLANAMKPVVMPGETMNVRIIKPGEEPGQGIGYLEDGTMIVAENSREKINEEVAITVTSVLQTSAGRMIFGRPEGQPLPPRRRMR